MTRRLARPRIASPFAFPPVLFMFASPRPLRSFVLTRACPDKEYVAAIMLTNSSFVMDPESSVSKSLQAK